jgi:filamentous hemagglutinin family protein
MNKRTSVGRSEWILMVMVGLLPLLWVPVSEGQSTSITSSGLNTQVSHVAGQQNFDITGGTRPGNGTNLFHSLGNFSVGAQDVARFVNDANLPTTNILSRVTGGNPSNIFGEINTTNFPGANLYLINPAGVLFGATATLNVSGSVHVSTADYLRLADGLRFNAIPGPQDSLLSQAPVVAFGFLNAHPRPITVQGSQLVVPDGKSLSLVGGDIRITGGTLTAPGGQVNLASLAGWGVARIAPEGLTIAGWTSRGHIEITGGTQPDHVARLDTSGDGGGAVVIRGGKLSLARAEVLTEATADNHRGGDIVIEGTKSARLDNAALRTGRSDVHGDAPTNVGGGAVSLTAPSVRASNLTIDTSGISGLAGDVTINVRTLTASNLNLLNSGGTSQGPPSGNISIQASGDVTLHNSGIGTNLNFNTGGENRGHITVRAATLELERTRMSSFSVVHGPADTGAGDIVIDVGRLTMLGSSIHTETVGIGSSSISTQAGNIRVSAREAILIDGAGVGAGISTFEGKSITVSTPRLTLDHLGHITTRSQGDRAGDISVNVRILNMFNGGRISTENFIFGSTGDINIVASQSISMAGVGVRSGLQVPTEIRSIATTSAPAGHLHIMTPSLHLADGAVVRAFSEQWTPSNDGIVLDVGRLDLLRGAKIESVGIGGGIPIVINAAKSITLDHGTITTANTSWLGQSGDVHLHAGKSIELRNGSLISADHTDVNDAGHIAIQAGKNVVIRDSTVSAQAEQGNGGTIDVRAKGVTLRGSQLTTSVSGGPDTVGGRIVVDAKNVTLRNSQILSTATEGDGGTIHIRSRAFQRDAKSVIDASSESGTDGTVTIESRY